MMDQFPFRFLTLNNVKILLSYRYAEDLKEWSIFIALC